MADFIVPRSKLVEVQILQAVGTLQFPTNLDDLNEANIYGVTVITTTEQTTAPSGRPVATAAELLLACLTLAKVPGSDKRLDLVPLYTTSRTLNFGEYFQFKPFRWNPSASGVNILTPGLNVARSFLFLFYYVPLRNGIEVE